MTTPTGRLAYGQAAAYDALDDRAVIRALSGGRVGLVTVPAVAAGSGLNVSVGPWIGIADCGDRTSGVAAAPVETLVEAAPGPPTGTREDLVWVDVDPDEGVWSMSVIPASAAAGRPGLAVASITVPANATLASQMTIRQADAGFDRRLWHSEHTETNVRTGQTWETVGNQAWVAVRCEPGRLYRVRFTASSPMAITSQYHPPGGRIGVGMRPLGAPDASSQLLRASVIGWAIINAASHANVEHIFRHPANAAPIDRWFDGRVWIAGTGSFRAAAVTTQGPPLVISVEDMGT